MLKKMGPAVEPWGAPEIISNKLLGILCLNTWLLR